MALRLKHGMEVQIVITLGTSGSGFDVLTRTRVSLGGQGVEKETSRRPVADEGRAWVRIAELAQEQLVKLAEAGDE